MAGREPVRDLVVVIPGIMGSVLARDGAEVWNLSREAAWQAVRSRLGSLRDLALPPDLGDDHPGDGVEAVDLMRTLHCVPDLWSPIVGYDGLLRWLRSSFTLDPVTEDHPGNLLAFPYDWRLSIRYNAGRLGEVLPPALERWRRASGDPAARAVLVCHSMGGLVARYFLEAGGGAELCRTLITLGTPYRGSLGALTTLVNGAAPRLGRLGSGLTGLARSLPSLHQLVPAYACVDGPDGLRHPLEAGLDGPDPSLLSDAAWLHEEIRAAIGRRGHSPYGVLSFRGLRQPTPTTASVDEDGRLVESSLIDGEDEGGDGRVPRLSAYPPEMYDTDAAIRGPVEGHGALPDHGPVRAELYQFFTGREKVHRGPEDAAERLRVRVPELILRGEPLPIEVAADSDRLAVEVRIESPQPDAGRVRRSLANRGAGRYTAVINGLDPGFYAVSVKTATGADAVIRHLTVGDGDE